MKKLLLAAMFGMVSFAALANNKVAVALGNISTCNGTQITVQFLSYQEGSCIFDIASPVYPVPGTYDLNDPALWAPGVLWMPSYEAYSAVIGIQCIGMSAPFYLPPVGIDMVPGHNCDPATTPSQPVPGNCCTPSISADVVGGGKGGVCFTLTVNQ